MALLTVLLLTASAGVAPIDSLLPLPPWRPHDTKADLFLIPHALTLDPLGRLWVLDRGRGRLMVLDSRGEGASFGVEGEDRSSAPTVADVAASGTYLFVLEPPVPSIALLDLDGFFRGRVDLAGEIEEAGWQGFLPARILVDRSGDLWLIEGSSGRLLRLDRRGRFLDAPLDALAGGIRPERIADAALGPDDGLLLLDPAASRIVLLNRDGVLLLAQDLEGPLAEPVSLAADRAGNRYLLEGSGRIRIFSPEGVTRYDGVPEGPRPSGPHRARVTREGILCRAEPASGLIRRWRIVSTGPEDGDR